MQKKSKKIGKKVGFLNLKFPSYLTSHSKPERLRRYVASKERLNRMDRSSFNAWKQEKKISKNDLTWPQAKIRYPLLKPFKDADRDGVKNMFDCKPFDKKRQGFFHKDQGVLDNVSVGFETIKEMKTVGDVQKLEESILRKEEED